MPAARAPVEPEASLRRPGRARARAAAPASARSAWPRRPSALALGFAWGAAFGAGLGAGGCGPATSVESSRLADNAKIVSDEATPARLSERGDAFAAGGDLMRAEQYFAAALEAGGDSAELTRKLIRVCTAEHRLHVAIKYAHDHLRHAPADHQIRFVLATLLTAVGKPFDARTELIRLVAATPEDADVHFALGVTYRETRDLLHADEEFRAYLKYQPDGPNADEARAGLLKTTAVPQR